MEGIHLEGRLMIERIVREIESGVAVNNRLISNGGLIGRSVASVEFLIAVENENCPMYKLRLQLGR